VLRSSTSERANPSERLDMVYASLDSSPQTRLRPRTALHMDVSANRTGGRRPTFPAGQPAGTGINDEIWAHLDPARGSGKPYFNAYAPPSGTPPCSSMRPLKTRDLALSGRQETVSVLREWTLYP
jgi:hypothetical protein